MKEKVCAIVVTYNRKKLLIECLESLLKQTRPLDAIYIIDNASTDKTPELLKEKGFIQELPPEKLNEPWEKEFKKDNLSIYYVRMNENTGGAGGFHEGVKRAYEKGYDWLWLMDDDVEAVENALEVMLHYKIHSKCIHPSKKYLNGDRFSWNGYLCEKVVHSIWLEENFKDQGFTCVNYGCFEGMLINSNVVKKIGFPERKYFFIGDDTIYGYKASQVTNVIYIKDICFVKKIDKRGFRRSKMAIYLEHRNLTNIFINIAQKKMLTTILRFFNAIKDSIRCVSYTPLIGFIDGILGVWGKEKKYLGK